MWKKTIIFIHWLSALFLIETILTTHYFASTFGISKSKMLYAHVTFGTVFIVILVLRLYFRLKNRRATPKSGKISTFLQHSLYTVMIALAVDSLLIGFKGIFSFVFFNQPFPTQFFIDSPFFDLHNTFSYILIALVSVHLVNSMVGICQKGNHSFSRIIGIEKSDTKPYAVKK